MVDDVNTRRGGLCPHAVAAAGGNKARWLVRTGAIAVDRRLPTCRLDAKFVFSL
jgi:hypothetical protein